MGARIAQKPILGKSFHFYLVYRSLRKTQTIAVFVDTEPANDHRLTHRVTLLFLGAVDRSLTLLPFNNLIPRGLKDFIPRGP